MTPNDIDTVRAALTEKPQTLAAIAECLPAMGLVEIADAVKELARRGVAVQAYREDHGNMFSSAPAWTAARRPA